MKINIFFTAIIFSILVSISIQIHEDHYYKTFLPKKQIQENQLEDLLLNEEEPEQKDIETEQGGEDASQEENEKDTEKDSGN